MFNDYKIQKLATQLSITSIKLFISIVISLLPITDIFRPDMPVNICIFVKEIKCFDSFTIFSATNKLVCVSFLIIGYF